MLILRLLLVIWQRVSGLSAYLWGEERLKLLCFSQPALDSGGVQA